MFRDSGHSRASLLQYARARRSYNTLYSFGALRHGVVVKTTRCCICRTDTLSRISIRHQLRHEVVCTNCGVYRIGWLREATSAPFWNYRDKRRSIALIRAANARGLVWDFTIGPKGSPAYDDRHAIATLANDDGAFAITYDGQSIICRRSRGNSDIVQRPHGANDWIVTVDNSSYATGIRHVGMSQEDAIPIIIAWYDRMKAAGGDYWDFVRRPERHS